MVFGNPDGIDVYKFNIKETKTCTVEIRADSFESAFMYMMRNTEYLLNKSNGDKSCDVSLNSFSVRDAQPYDLVEGRY